MYLYSYTSYKQKKIVFHVSAIGNPRGHENPFLLSFGILWFRWHNLIADQIAAENSSLTDEQIFNIARKRVIAQYQVKKNCRLLQIAFLVHF
jgi:hypothetical protein